MPRKPTTDKKVDELQPEKVTTESSTITKTQTKTEEIQPSNESENKPSDSTLEKTNIGSTKKTSWSIFSHPAFNFIGLIVGILGLFFGFYFYNAAKIYPQLVAYTLPVKTTIVKSGQASEIKTIYKDKEINTDVTAAQIAIWNQGNASIKKENILKPIIISTQNNTPILEATIRKSTREDVTKLTLNSEEIQNGRLTVSWNILEQNDGGVIQVVYAGNSETTIGVEGTIEGQKEIIKSTKSRDTQSLTERFSVARIYRTFWLIYLLIIWCFIGGIYTLYRSVKQIKFFILKKNYIGISFYVIYGLVGLLFFAFCIFVIYFGFFNNNLIPPFELG